MHRRDTSDPRPSRQQRPSFARSFNSSRSYDRRRSSVAEAEQGLHDAHASAEEAFHEEIAEIKRYEVGTETVGERGRTSAD